METPLIVIKGCAEHSTVRGGRIGAVMSGPGSSEAAQEFIRDTLMCWKCWDLDEQAMLAVTAALHLAPQETVMLRLGVMRRKFEANRN